MHTPRPTESPNHMKRTQTTLLIAAIAISLTALLRPAPTPAYANVASSDSPIAVCALPTLINELMASDRFLPDREAYTEELSQQINELLEKRNELQQELSNMNPEDPGAQETFGEYQSLNQKIARLRQENSQKIETFTAKQIKECNRLVRSSARAVAEDLGFEFVISSADPQEDLAETVDALFRQLTSRPVIMFPEENDITADVRDDLNLE